MWGSILVRMLARAWVRRVLGFGLSALTIVLFIIDQRRAGERAGRAA